MIIILFCLQCRYLLLLINNYNDGIQTSETLEQKNNTCKQFRNKGIIMMLNHMYRMHSFNLNCFLWHFEIATFHTEMGIAQERLV